MVFKWQRMGWKVNRDHLRHSTIKTNTIHRNIIKTAYTPPFTL